MSAAEHYHIIHTTTRAYATSMTSVCPSVTLVDAMNGDRIVKQKAEIDTWQDSSVFWLLASRSRRGS